MSGSKSTKRKNPKLARKFLIKEKKTTAAKTNKSMKTKNT